MTFVFDIPEFRIAYPAFSDTVKFPDATLQRFWDTATCYMSDVNYGYLRDDCRSLALNLMTAHLTSISVLIASGKGKTSVLVQGTAVDKISVTLTPPVLTTQFQWWLSTSPYGQQLLALLQAKIVGGFYIGGSLDRAAFRGPTGFF